MALVLSRSKARVCRVVLSKPGRRYRPIVSILSISFDKSNFDRKLGSLGQSPGLCPYSLQLYISTTAHCTACSLTCSISSFSTSNASSSPLLSCFEVLQPSASFPCLPQHHHISPLYSPV